MKKVIAGRVYDTDTAEKIGSRAYGYGGDLSHWEETLYITKKGAFFVAGSGGPMSRWAVRTGDNETSGSSGIRLLDKQEALEWAEDADISAEEIEKYFKVEEA